MSTSAPVERGQHLLLYDGVCGLCNSVVRAVLARDPRGVFHFAPLQSEMAHTVLDPWGMSPDELSTFYVVRDYRRQPGRPLTKGRAAVFVGRALGWPWHVVAAAAAWCPTTVLDAIYDVVARRRYRIFGRFDTCPIPRPEHRDRFVGGVERSR